MNLPSASTLPSAGPSRGAARPVLDPREAGLPPRLSRHGLAARAVLRALSALRCGSLSLHTPGGATLRFEGREAGPQASLVLSDWAVATRVLGGGDIGFAEAWIDGQWNSPDPAALLRLLLANRAAIEGLVYGRGPGLWLHRLRHGLNRNSRQGSRRNIHAHYDLGNAFYRLWLDPSMNYSSAWFEGRPDQPLEQAQWAKVRRALRQAAVKPGDRVLEIGCGWGALAECATREFGAQVTGVTLSTEQLAWAQERVQRAGVDAACDLRLQDYRDLGRDAAAPGFDAVLSIEMFEAVGREYWADYFAALRRTLRPGGRACIQSITIRDALFERYVRSTDFIQQYVFPGGLLPSVEVFHAEAARAGFVVTDTFAFGRDYAETLRRWRTAFEAALPAVRGLGFDARFERLWVFYLAYCEAAFDSGDTDVVQFTLAHA
jgi:cyclopropane-fatty-acyl-phospholipid synthase